MDDETSAPDSSENERSRYAPGNTAPDGSYRVGRGRPPRHTRFAAGDGRPRGRRPKGQKNLDTEFLEEAMRKVTIREGGKVRKVTKIQATVIRALDKAGAQGSVPAINAVLGHAHRIAARQAQQPMPDRGLEPDEEALLETWIEEEVARRMAGPTPGDPLLPRDDAGDADDVVDTSEGGHDHD